MLEFLLLFLLSAALILLGCFLLNKCLGKPGAEPQSKPRSRVLSKDR